ncbi:MAG: diguanylate cyclase [Campylobacterota bacterium]
MSTTYKYLLLYGGVLILFIAIIYGTSLLRDKNVEFQKDILVKQAQTHFQDQINNRAWNSQYGGVFVRPANDLKPNPHLNNNTIKTESGETLVKINPAWMTRQLSEISSLKDFKFRITSLLPINPNNRADEFETRALEYIESTNDQEYHELNENGDFRYMGGLVTAKSCLPCHEHQGYKLGDIRGGVSISLDTANYREVVKYIEDKVFQLRVLLIFLLLSLLWLIHKQFRSNEHLQNIVTKRTKEILSTKILLQEVLDTDLSFLMVSDETDIILANKTMLDFFNVRSLDEFKKNHKHISDAFVEVQDEDFLSTYMGEEHWINYLQKEQHNRQLKVLMRFDGQNRYFKPHIKEITIEDKKLHIIIFDEITKELKNIEVLEEKASKDSLTQLFNRSKFDDVLSQEISLTNTTQTPLSIIFLDIDHFKAVNDNYGHDAGDSVLVELANILTNTTRNGDFIARWGGEEFVITLQSTTVLRASVIAEKIRESVEEYNFKSGGSQTVSLGVSEYIYGESKESLIKRVDEALYNAKNSGRNRVVIR